jgi:hypothetical protein
MSETNRRKFLAAAGAGAAAGVVGITAGPAFAGGTARSKASAKETVVAYVDDHHGSEITLMMGDREVVVHDRDLVTRILNAAGGE